MSSRRFRESSSNFLSSCRSQQLLRGQAASLEFPLLPPSLTGPHPGTPAPFAGKSGIMPCVWWQSFCFRNTPVSCEGSQLHFLPRLSATGDTGNIFCCFDGNLNRPARRTPSCPYLQTLCPTLKANKHRTTENPRKTLSNESALPLPAGGFEGAMRRGSPLLGEALPCPTSVPFRPTPPIRSLGDSTCPICANTRTAIKAQTGCRGELL